MGVTYTYKYMYWNCPSCDSKRIRGDKEVCPGCGAPIPNPHPEEGIELFYNVPDAEAITDPKEIALAESGAYWACECCERPNLQVISNCRGCGAPKGNSQDYVAEGKPLNPVEPTVPEEYGDEPDFEEMVDEGELPKPTRRASSEPYIFYRKRPDTTTYVAERPRWHYAVAIAALLLAAGLFAYFKTWPVELKVEKFNWERGIDLEEYRTLHEGDWSIPAGGRQTNSYRKIHHYDHVVDHYETRTRTVTVQTGTSTRTGSRTVSLGNGRSRTETYTYSVPVYGQKTESYQEAVYRDDPVYRTWYDYDIERWVYTCTLNTSGTDQSPHWAEFKEIPGKLRERGRNAHYRLSLCQVKDPDQRYIRELEEGLWSTMFVDQKVTGHANIFGVVRWIDWPKSGDGKAEAEP